MESVGDPREGPSTERAFEGEPVQAWTEQITVRSVVASILLGTILSTVGMNLVFMSGGVSPLNIPAAMLSLFLLKIWTHILRRFDVFHQPFTRQENTIIQTCVVACASMVSSGGFGSFMLAMSPREATETKAGPDEINVSSPNLGKLIVFYFLISFVGLFAIVPMRKAMIIRHRLTYATGTATAHLINSFHTPQGAQEAKRQVSAMFTSLAGSLCWDIFQWFYTGGRNCGLAAIPTFGLKAYQKGFYFNFSATYVGVGMICPTVVSMSMLVGTILSSAIMLPYIESKKGVWYNAFYKENSMMGIYGYKVLITIAMMLGDGLFQLLMIPFKSMSNLRKKQQQLAATTNAFRSVDAIRHPVLSFDDRRRTHIFLKDNIPFSYAIIGYTILATVSTIAIPHIYSQIKYQHIIVAYMFAPLLAFCNAYGTGITDLNLYTQYAKIVILIFGFWITAAKGGVIGGLVICAIMTIIIATAGNFMQDLKTGYLTLTSPRSLFLAQVIGTAIGCIINPIIFWVFYYCYLNDSMGSYPAPFARVYRIIALVGAGGFIKLPKHSLALSIPVFFIAIATSAIKEVAIHKKWRIQHYIPSVAAMSVAFLIHPTLSIDMCVGSLILLAWNKVDTESAELLAPVVASGLICGEGIFAIPYSLLGIYHVTPPMCIRFLASDVNSKVDAFLAKQAP
ncbi:hypothetical protein SETIT_1G118000v2 [Setaria italica]|uniref:Uncharacterized protein n=1 Tax=Setaria italica TaxID=4555 RepID=K3YY49_SETIT|nr:hypothetical protein SETIT_1G118000v2 [Setaria italica]